MKHVFISSTVRDLSTFRSAVVDALQKSEMAPTGLEFFHTDETAPREKCTREVEESDFYILIIGFRYGAIVPDELYSFTELEYLTALKEHQQRQLPIRVYLLDDRQPLPNYIMADADVDRTRVIRFRNEVSERQVVEFCSSPDDLAKKVLEGILAAKYGEPIDLYRLAQSMAPNGIAIPQWVGLPETTKLRPEAILESTLIRPASNERTRDDEEEAFNLVNIIQDGVSGTVVVTGRPGIGKSTALQALTSKLIVDGKLAFFLDASDVASLRTTKPELSTAELLAYSVAIRSNIPSLQQRTIVSALIRQSPTYLVDQAEDVSVPLQEALLSGADWSPSGKQETDHEVQQTTPGYSLVLALRTWRGSGGLHGGRDRRVIELQPWTIRIAIQFGRFICRAAGLDAEAFASWITELDDGTSELVRHPLFLLMALATKSFEQKDISQVALTERAIRHLLTTKQNRQGHERILHELTDSELASLGAASTTGRKQPLHQWIETVGSALPTGDLDAARNILSTALSAGLLLEDASGVTLAHQVFAEHLSAVWLSYQLQNVTDDDNKLISYATSEIWTSVLPIALVRLCDHHKEATALEVISRLRGICKNDILLSLLHLDKIALCTALHYSSSSGVLSKELPGALSQLFEECYTGLHHDLIFDLAFQLRNIPEVEGICENLTSAFSINDVAEANLLLFCQLPRRAIITDTITRIAQRLSGHPDSLIKSTALDYLLLANIGSEDAPSGERNEFIEIVSIERKFHEDKDPDAIPQIKALLGRSSSLQTHLLGLQALAHLTTHDIPLADVADVLASEVIDTDNLLDSLQEIKDKKQLLRLWHERLVKWPNIDSEHMFSRWSSKLLDTGDLLSLLNDTPPANSHLRRVIISSLVSVASSGGTITSDLLDLTRSGQQTFLRASTLRSLGYDSVPETEEIRAAFEQALTSSNQVVRTAAAVGSWIRKYKTGFADSYVLPALGSNDSQTRLMLSYFLPFISPTVFSRVVRKLIRDKSESVRSNLLWQLQFNPLGKTIENVNAIALLARDKDWYIRANAMRALAKFPERQAIKDHAKVDFLDSIRRLTAENPTDQVCDDLTRAAIHFIELPRDFGRLISQNLNSQSSWVNVGMIEGIYASRSKILNWKDDLQKEIEEILEATDLNQMTMSNNWLLLLLRMIAT